MADRFMHEDGVKAQDVEMRGGKLVRARKGRMGHEASRMAEKGYVDRDKRGMTEKRAEIVSEAAEVPEAGQREQKGVSSYLKSKKKTLAELDEALKY
jgi:hypothetical protein